MTEQHPLTHGQRIAGAIIDHIDARDVHYARRALALRDTYEALVKAIDDALCAKGAKIGLSR